MQPVEIHREVIYPKQTALECLSSKHELTPQQIQRCFDNGAVWLQKNGKPQRLYAADKRVQPGQTLHCYCNDSTLTDCPYRPELIEDFGSFSVWNKPAGMLSQGSKWGDHWTLYRWIEQYYWPQRDSFITHRLDRFTQGLMIVAHDAKTNQAFHRLFEQRQIEKTYRAQVRGQMTPGQQRLLQTEIDGKAASSQLKVLSVDADNNSSLVEIQPHTGRKHQIRIHLASIGHPVINDRRYGEPPYHGDLMLQACALAFNHPQERRRIDIHLTNNP